MSAQAVALDGLSFFRLNTSYEPRQPLDPGLQMRLQREFAPEVEDLGEPLGRDLTHWSKGPEDYPFAGPPGHERRS